MEIKYVEDRIIFETIVGSRAYNIHTKDSDADIAGIMIPGKEYFLGFDNFEQFQGFPKYELDGISVEDKVIYDLRKAVRLISDNNPNMLDLIAIPDRCIIKTTKYWDIFRENQDLFISKKAKYTYAGYAISQLRRIRNHRKFLFNPINKKPDRKDFNLPEHTIFPTVQLKSIMSAALELIPEEDKTNFVNELDNIYKIYVIPTISKFLSDKERIVALEWLQMSTKSQAKAFMTVDKEYIKEEYVEMARNEVKYYDALKEYQQYKQWEKGRNEERAETEKKFKYDTKHAGHLFRLMNMGKEILQTGKINVDRSGIDAEEIKAIRAGSWKFEEIEEFAEKMDKELDELYEKSILQRSPQVNKIKEILVSVCDEYLSGK